MKKRLTALFALCLSWGLLTPAGAAPTWGYTTTAVGTGFAEFGSDGVATDIGSNRPRGMAFDSAGNLYFAESGNDRVRKVDTDGNITTVAGTGTPDLGLDGPAITSALNFPYGVAIDSDDNLYIADTMNHRIQKVDTDGNVSTVAGTGTEGLGANGIATGSELSRPHSVAFDSVGNLYIADSSNQRIQKVDTDGQVSTVAGTSGSHGTGPDGPALGSAMLSPLGIAIDAEDNLYIADTYNHRVRVLDDSGNVTTIAGTGVAGTGDDGPATASALNVVSTIEFDSEGNLYLVDTDNNRVRRVDTDGNILTVAGTGAQGVGTDGPATSSALNRPYGVALDSNGDLYISDAESHRIQKVTYDNEAPVAEIESTPNRLSDQTPINFSCVDAGGSGINSCDATLNADPISSGHLIPTRGSYTLVITATDNSGYSSTQTATFEVAGKRELTDAYANVSGETAALARLYMATFSRNPDAPGHAYWRAQLDNNMTLGQVANQFIASPEFMTWQDSDADSEFVERLYTNVLTRPSEDEGYEYWLNRLDAGMTRAEMLVWFSQSPEFKAITYTD